MERSKEMQHSFSLHRCDLQKLNKSLSMYLFIYLFYSFSFHCIFLIKLNGLSHSKVISFWEIITRAHLSPVNGMLELPGQNRTFVDVLNVL